MIKQNMKYFNRLFVLVDIILVVVSLYLAWYLRIESGIIPKDEWTLGFNAYMQPLFFLVPIELISYKVFNLYKPHRTKSILDEIFGLLKANTVSILFFLSYLYFFNIVHYSRYVMIIFVFTNILLGIFERIVLRLFLRKIRSKSKNIKHIILVGYSDLANEYAKRIFQNKHWGYEIVGIFDNCAHSVYASLYKKPVRVLGKVNDLNSFLESEDIDEVIITLALKDYLLLEKIVEICEKQGVYTRIIPDYYRIIPAKPYLEEIDGLPVIAIRKVPLDDIMNRFLKRSMDIIGSLLGLLIFSPVFLVVSIAISLSSKGPIFYRQTRVGLNKHLFEMYKFRTMCIQTKEEEKHGWTTRNDPRVTKIGRIIRMTSIDELPQLWNVLKGDMSLIGPRPERPQFVERYKEEIPKYMVKHQVRPGMTGWAQIHGYRGDTSIKKRIEYDLFYIENWNLKTEIYILLMTFIKGFINKNAY